MTEVFMRMLHASIQPTQLKTHRATWEGCLVVVVLVVVSMCAPDKRDVIADRTKVLEADLQNVCSPRNMFLFLT
jgi:hypothetical protein